MRTRFTLLFAVLLSASQLQAAKNNEPVDVFKEIKGK
jgi:hypothetical protein